jgi:hypothetical protein
MILPMGRLVQMMQFQGVMSIVNILQKSMIGGYVSLSILNLDVAVNFFHITQNLRQTVYSSGCFVHLKSENEDIMYIIILFL